MLKGNLISLMNFNNFQKIKINLHLFFFLFLISINLFVNFFLICLLIVMFELNLIKRIRNSKFFLQEVFLIICYIAILKDDNQVMI